MNKNRDASGYLNYINSFLTYWVKYYRVCLSHNLNVSKVNYCLCTIIRSESVPYPFPYILRVVRLATWSNSSFICGFIPKFFLLKDRGYINVSYRESYYTFINVPSLKSI